MYDYEKLGVFYMGRSYDIEAGQCGTDPVLYDSKDLNTHAVIVGMTGSGKTGLGITMLEEAAIDGIPSIVIDPKGDLGNLLLTFPDLSAAAFRPWINEDDAARAQQDPDTFAAAQAAFWAKGLASWGQDAARIARLQYREGAVSYLNVIDAERSVLQQQRLAVGLDGERARSTVNLIRALGGGWTAPPKASAAG
ncbi:DUF87 domain-containing protein [Zoogloea sp.]|uniref:helicase HerA domain-containing protein n=1 Tax=Zoogloea sp. TaxID=49181 RepID=UPI001AC07441|nr:DUF87 domain-containing protein [Zoogloea sp.]MBN8284647.1 DUF853 family protein [Zoogloea sp.]